MSIALVSVSPGQPWPGPPPSYEMYPVIRDLADLSHLRVEEKPEVVSFAVSHQREFFVAPPVIGPPPFTAKGKRPTEYLMLPCWFSVADFALKIATLGYSTDWVEYIPFLGTWEETFRHLEDPEVGPSKTLKSMDTDGVYWDTTGVKGEFGTKLVIPVPITVWHPADTTIEVLSTSEEHELPQIDDPQGRHATFVLDEVIPSIPDGEGGRRLALEAPFTQLVTSGAEYGDHPDDPYAGLTYAVPSIVPKGNGNRRSSLSYGDVLVFKRAPDKLPSYEESSRKSRVTFDHWLKGSQYNLFERRGWVLSMHGGMCPKHRDKPWLGHRLTHAQSMYSKSPHELLNVLSDVIGLG